MGAPLMGAAGTLVITVVAFVLVLCCLPPDGRRPLLGGRVRPWLRRRRWWPFPAERAAETLLRDTLADGEYRRLCATGHLDVPSPSRPGRAYRIPRGPGLVLVLEGGRVAERLCVQPASGGLPEADVVLLHKLLIEADEDAYLQVANHFPRAIWH